MTADPQALKLRAEAATPGPWDFDGIKCDGEYGSGEDAVSGFMSYAISKDGEVICDMLNSCLICVSEEIDEDQCYAWDEIGNRNAAFIAGANPAAILDLIAQLEQAKADAARYQWLKSWCKTGGFDDAAIDREIAADIKSQEVTK